MEGKPQGDDFNASLETKNSNEVWFCIILEGREGKVKILAGQRVARLGTRPTQRSLPIFPHLSYPPALTAP